MRTLIEKELRENLRWLLVGLALIGPLLWYAVPKSLAIEVRHTEHGIATMMFFGASLFAIGLGVMQSFADLRTASRSFLFHRSVSIGTIFYSKLIVGAIIYFVAVGIPLLWLSPSSHVHVSPLGKMVRYEIVALNFRLPVDPAWNDYVEYPAGWGGNQSTVG